VLVVADGEAAERALVFANTSKRDALRQVSLQCGEGEERQHDPGQRQHEWAECDRIDVVRDVVTGHHQGEDRRGADDRKRDREVARATAPEAPQQPVAEAEQAEYEPEPEQERNEFVAIETLRVGLLLALVRGLRGRPGGLDLGLSGADLRLGERELGLRRVPCGRPPGETRDLTAPAPSGTGQR
jgi:hypothetical protein